MMASNLGSEISIGRGGHYIFRYMLFGREFKVAKKTALWNKDVCIMTSTACALKQMSCRRFDAWLRRLNPFHLYCMQSNCRASILLSKGFLHLKFVLGTTLCPMYRFCPTFWLCQSPRALPLSRGPYWYNTQFLPGNTACPTFPL